MRTNIEIDDKLMRQAMKATGLATKKATVEEALKRVVAANERQRRMQALAGKYPDWGADYKAMRVNPHLDK